MGFKQKATVRLIGLPCDSMTCLIYIHLPALLSAARKSGVSTEFHGRSCQPWPLGHSLSISLGTISRRLTHAPPADGLVTVAPADRRHMEAPMAQRTSRLVKCLNPREPIITNPSQSFKPFNEYSMIPYGFRSDLLQFHIVSSWLAQIFLRLVA